MRRIRTRLTLAGAVAALSTPAAAAPYELLSMDADRVQVIDIGSKHAGGGLNRVWITEVSGAVGFEAMYAKQLIAVDCDGRRWRREYGVVQSDEGKTLHTYKEASEFVPIIPGSTGERFLRALCGTPKKGEAVVGTEKEIIARARVIMKRIAEDK